MHERRMRQRITNKNDTKDIFSDTSNQGRNAFKVKRKDVSDTSNRGSRGRSTHCWIARIETVQRLGRFQDIAFDTLLSTLLTLPPTVRIEAMAATAINEAISVYSIAVAPSAFFTR